MTLKEVVYPSLHAAKESLRSSAEKSMQLKHPHICTVDDCFLAPNASDRAISVLVKLGMEDAKTKLIGKLDTAGKWKEEELLIWLSTLADALRFAQNKSISHGDIKLEFILFNSSDQPMLFGFEAEVSTQAVDKDVRDLGVAFAQLATLQTELQAAEEAVEAIEHLQLKDVLKAMVGKGSQPRPSFADIMHMCQLPTRLVSDCMMCLQKVVDSEWTLTLPADLQSLPKEQFTSLCSLKCTRKFSLLDKPAVKCTGCLKPLKADEIAGSPAPSCGHPFHSSECLKSSLEKYIDCPACSASGAGNTEVDALLALQADRCTMCLIGQRIKVYGICGHALCQECDKWSVFSLWRSKCQQCNLTS
jgi:serine/threonine protein kinase